MSFGTEPPKSPTPRRESWAGRPLRDVPVSCGSGRTGGASADRPPPVPPPGEAAKPEEGVALLQLLRGHFDGRFDFRAEGPGKSRFVRGQEASAWAGECLQHDGFAVLRRQVLAAERLRELDNAGLSAVYMQLRKMRLEEAAREVWPAVESRILSGELRETRPLVDIWRVAPEDMGLWAEFQSLRIPANPYDLRPLGTHSIIIMVTPS